MCIRRCLTPVFIEALNALYDSPSMNWWKRLVDDADVFIAIRDDSINAYSRGGSIGRITWENGSIRLRVHVEYLTLPSGPDDDPYVQLVPAGPLLSRNVVSTVDEFVTHLDRVKDRPP